MSTIPNISDWPPVGESLNTRYFLIEEHVIAALPSPGAKDDAASARSNVDFQNAWFAKNGAGVVVVYFDNMVSQDKTARAVYQTQPDLDIFLGTALVGGTLLSRAMASFFMGLSRPRVPVKMFSNTDDALVWARERIKEKRT